MAVYLAQLVCGPYRHAILAAAFDDVADAPEAHRQLLRAATTIDQVCGICRSPRSDWKVETAKTKFETMAEAEPALKASMAAQLATRAAIAQRRLDDRN